jgi:hypothetical protein
MPGSFGIAAGPDVHVIDVRGRTDPLLARLPAAVGSRWRWGAPRRVPDGYLAGLAGEADAITDEPIARLREALNLITRAPLAADGRVAAIAGLSDRRDTLVRESSYGPDTAPLAELNGSEDPRMIPEGGLLVLFDGPRPVAAVSATLSARYDYDIDLLDGESVLHSTISPKLMWAVTPDRVRRIDIGEPVVATALRFQCGRGAGPCALSHVSISP